jgi:hypothetical protein
MPDSARQEGSAATYGLIDRDLVIAIAGTENALAALSDGEARAFDVIVMDPFQTSPPDQKIRVMIRWRAAIRSRFFSTGTLSKRTTVRNMMDLRRDAERRRVTLGVAETRAKYDRA